jgi:hypothetical protein
MTRFNGCHTHFMFVGDPLVIERWDMTMRWLIRMIWGLPLVALAVWAVVTFVPTERFRPFGAEREAPTPDAAPQPSGRDGLGEVARRAEEPAASSTGEEARTVARAPANEVSVTPDPLAVPPPSRREGSDPETLAKLRAALQAVSPGAQESSEAVIPERPSPYTFRARREAGTLTLTGYYPDNSALAAIHQLIRARFFSEQVVDKLRAGDGAPRNYLAGVSFGLEHLARLASGEVAVSGTALELNGEALYEQTAEQIVRAVPAMSVRGWSGKAEVRLRPSGAADAEQARSPQP